MTDWADRAARKAVSNFKDGRTAVKGNLADVAAAIAAALRSARNQGYSEGHKTAGKEARAAAKAAKAPAAKAGASTLPVKNGSSTGRVPA